MIKIARYIILSVATLIRDNRPAGDYTQQWDGLSDTGHSLASGLYLYRLRTERGLETRKMLLLR
ncbi:MAG: hypothetical protein GKR89_27150 [Candidatus Latescibacteria bacterium]|nr:hypothetical protein [Candidatus Latescibacterota bacterium]